MCMGCVQYACTIPLYDDCALLREQRERTQFLGIPCVDPGARLSAARSASAKAQLHEPRLGLEAVIPRSESAPRTDIHMMSIGI